MIEQALASFGPARRAPWALGLCLAIFALFGAAVAATSAQALGLAGLTALSMLLLVAPWSAFVVAGLLLAGQQVALGWLEPGSLAARLGSQADDALLVVLTACAWLARPRDRALPHAVRVAVALGLSALSIGAVTAFVRGTPAVIVGLDAFSLGKGFLALAAAAWLPSSETKFDQVATWVTRGALVLAIWGFVDLAFPALTHGAFPLAGPVAFRNDYRCLVSALPNEGMSGWFFAAAACLPLGRYLVLRRRVDLVLSGFLILTSLLSYRRKPVLGLVLAIAVALLVHNEARSRRRLLVALGLIAVLVVPIIGEAMGESFVEAWSGYVATAAPMEVARNALYIASWRIAVDNFPVGAGLGLFGGHASTLQYSEFYTRYGLSRVWGLTPEAPNFVSDAQYPHLLGALGVSGALLFLLAIAWILRALGSVVRTTESPELRAFAIGGLLISVEALVEGVAAPVYETALPCLLIFGLAGVALSTTRGSATRPVGAADAVP